MIPVIHDEEQTFSSDEHAMLALAEELLSAANSGLSDLTANAATPELLKTWAADWLLKLHHLESELAYYVSQSSLTYPVECMCEDAATTLRQLEREYRAIIAGYTSTTGERTN